MRERDGQQIPMAVDRHRSMGFSDDFFGGSLDAFPMGFETLSLR
jgi:hypothetical protein